MIELIKERRAELEKVCRRFHVKTLALFGSAAEGGWEPARSDLDFLVDFLPEASNRIFAGYFDLKEELEKLFERKVDLVMPGGIRNPYFLKAVKKQRQVVYAA